MPKTKCARQAYLAGGSSKLARPSHALVAARVSRALNAAEDSRLYTHIACSQASEENLARAGEEDNGKNSPSCGAARRIITQRDTFQIARAVLVDNGNLASAFSEANERPCQLNLTG